MPPTAAIRAGVRGIFMIGNLPDQVRIVPPELHAEVSRMNRQPIS